MTENPININATGPRDNIENIEYNLFGGVSYEKAKEKIFAMASIPNGFFGDRVNVGFFLHNNFIMCLHESGYFRSHFPCCSCEKEALWILENHPTSKSYIKNLTEV